MNKEKIIEHFDLTQDPEFRDQAIAICQDLGIPEDEADLLVDDYINLDLY